MNNNKLFSLAAVFLVVGCAVKPPSGPESPTAAPPPAPPPPPSHPVARDPLPNTATNTRTDFVAEAAIHKGCSNPPPAPEGDITYSGIVSLGGDRWVYVRDTKNCVKNAIFGNQMFGVIEEQNEQIVGTEVRLDLSGIPRLKRPTDIEAICLAGDPETEKFELLAAESGGFKSEDYRRIYKFEFEKNGDHWTAKIAGGPANYHHVVESHRGAPPYLEVEGMICSRNDDNTYQVLLGGRGKHHMMHEQGWEKGQGKERWVEHNGGGLLPLIVDFSTRTGAFAFSGIGDHYPEVMAKRCAIPNDWSVIKGEWRDIADLYAEDSVVWASATFEGKIGRKNSTDEEDYFCSVIYQLCATSDCRDLWSAPLARQVAALEISDRKIEGLTAGTAPNTFAIATDEEESGFIRVNSPRPCNDDSCNVQVLTFPRTKFLEDPVDKALGFPDDEDVLVVFDVDDTLITMPQYLGGNSWYTWQDRVIKGFRPKVEEKKIGGQDKSFNVAFGNNVGQLLDIQGILYTQFEMQPTQPKAVDQAVFRLKAGGITTYALTARGPDFHDATHRELGDLGFTFPNAPACKAPLCSNRGVIAGSHVVTIATTPGTATAPTTQLTGVTAGELSGGRDIAIDHGVLMVSGMNKGIMLRLLLKNLDTSVSFDHIVFVDDDAKNVINVAKEASVLAQDGITIYPYHYSGVAAKAARFLHEDDGVDLRLEATNQWIEIRDAICAIEKKDWCSFPPP